MLHAQSVCRYLTLLWVGLVLMALPARAAQAPKEVHLTLYQQGSSVVQATYPLALQSGSQSVVLGGLPETLEANSLFLQAPSGSGVQLLQHQLKEPTFNSTEALLKASVGQSVWVNDITQNPLKEAGKAGYMATLKALYGGAYALVEVPSGKGQAAPQELLVNQQDVVLRHLPPAVEMNYGLQLQLNSPKAQALPLKALYLAGGLAWDAAYQVVLSPNLATAALQGWASLQNNTQYPFINAQVQLLAGEPKRVNAPQVYYAMAKRANLMMADGATEAMGMNEAAQEAMGDYYLYTLPAPLNLPAQSKVQAGLLQADAVPTTVRYTFDPNPGYLWLGYQHNGDDPLSQPRQSVAVSISLAHEAKGPLSKPLPAGVVRVLQPDSQGRLQLMGEDRIGHLPVGEPLRVGLGNAFDVKATKTQTQWKSTSSLEEATFKVVLFNEKDVAVTVQVVETLSDPSWNLVYSTSKPQGGVNVGRLVFSESVPAHGQSTLTYRVKRAIKK